MSLNSQTVYVNMDDRRLQLPRPDPSDIRVRDCTGMHDKSVFRKRGDLATGQIVPIAGKDSEVCRLQPLNRRFIEIPGKPSSTCFLPTVLSLMMAASSEKVSPPSCGRHGPSSISWLKPKSRPSDNSDSTCSASADKSTSPDLRIATPVECDLKPISFLGLFRSVVIYFLVPIRSL